MNKFYWLLILFSSCGSQEVSKEQRTTTVQWVEPKTFHFDEYTFVSNGGSNLKLYYKDSEILVSNSSDGFYDTIMKANLNNDGIPDFLVSYAYEDGAELIGIISKNEKSFKEKRLLAELSTNYCSVNMDTLNYILPLQVKDINSDGKDDIISNLVKINNQVFAIACTDTLLSPY